jgi:DNA-directed RNA polymerase specialized sigma24 family protein
MQEAFLKAFKNIKTYKNECDIRKNKDYK